MRRLVLLIACLLGILFPAAAVAGTIEGTVTPLTWAQEVEVCVAESVRSEDCTAPTADGSYVLGNLGGPVRIEFVPSHRSGLLIQYYDHKSTLAEATLVTVPPENKVRGIDADLVEGGAIEGAVVAAAGGEPLAEVEVCGVSVDMPISKSCGETDANGEYELRSLPTGFYKVGFWGEGASAGYEPWYHQAVRVTAGNTTTGVDASLAKGGRIRGAVSAAAGGARLAGITVCLFGAGEPKPQRCTYSAGAGEYSFAGLPSGSYQVGFSLAAGEISGGGTAEEEDGFESQYYDGVGARVQATTISVLGPETIDGVDASLSIRPRSPSPAPTPSLSAPTVAAAPIVPEPVQKKRGCKKPKRRKKVKGRVRCVRVVRHKSRRHHQHRLTHRRKGGGGHRKRRTGT